MKRWNVWFKGVKPDMIKVEAPDRETAIKRAKRFWRVINEPEVDEANPTPREVFKRV